jgi:hypothetical protein
MGSGQPAAFDERWSGEQVRAESPPRRRREHPSPTVLIILALTAVGGFVAFNVKKHAYRRAVGISPYPMGNSDAAEPVTR